MTPTKAFEIARVVTTETRRIVCFTVLNGKTIRLPVTERTTEITLREVAP